MGLFARARSRFASLLLVSSFIVPGVVAHGAHAANQVGTADPELSSNVDSSGTGSLVTTVRTRALRNELPATPGARILVIGTGIQRSLFPSALQSSISGDTTDPHGYGTLAASSILQVMPDAQLISRAVRPRDANWFLVDLDSVTSALSWARANRSSFDAVLLAFPPQAALDPISYSIGYGNYGQFGRGMEMVTEALLSTRASTKGPAVGIPTDRALRDALFARANLKQRDAVETFAVHAQQWRRTVAAVDALASEGVAVVAPSGDFTRRSGSQIVPLPTQTVYGLSALPSVITVGAAYFDGQSYRVSPTSGRGPTLALGLKPDVLAPADVLAMLPGSARLSWSDDSSRAPLQMLEWAKPGVMPTACPSVQGLYRCVLQGSTMVSAALVTANVAAKVASGSPHGAGARSSTDDDVLRGFVVAQASRTPARASDSDRAAFAWEQGAGVLTGLRALDPATTPIPLKRADIGEVSWDSPASATVPVWAGGASVTAAQAAITSFVGPDPSGQAVATAYPDARRVAATAGSGVVSLTATGARAQGGIYAGSLTLSSTGGQPVAIPLALTQTVPVDVHVDYAYNEFQTNGREGERVEDAAVVLFAGLPTNVGLVGEAFKNFGSSAWARFGGDPTNSVVIRAAVTQSVFRSPNLPSHEHGRARIRDVPPGFYRFHVMTDHAMEARQARGRIESVGIQLATSGPEGLNQAGSSLLVPACTGSASGPLGCARRDGTIEPSSGLCTARNGTTQVAFHVYCGEIGYAVPAATVTRAVHQIEFDADRARSEWKTCGIDVPTDGTPLDLGQIQQRAVACGGTATAPTAWSFQPGARDCVGPTERSRFPDGVPTDVTATYNGPGPASLAGRNLPVGVLTYEFKLPYLNTYTTAGLATSYVTENAIVAVRFRASGDPNADASSSVLAWSGPNVASQPAVAGASARGSRFQEWAVMSSNASIGQLSIIVIPTVWARTDLDPTKPIARVQLCDAALRVLTFAKQAWGLADANAEHHFPTLDRGLRAQIDPAKSRIRPAWNGSAFVDAGEEREDLRFAVQVPKNTTMDASLPHHVRSPHGGPATFTGARRWGTDAKRHEHVLDDDYRTHDPQYGRTSLACSDNAADPVLASTCKAWKAARANSAIVAELGPDLSVNGRFSGILAVGVDTLERAQGNLAYGISSTDDGGAFERRWSGSKTFDVPNFYDEQAPEAPLTLLAGLLSFTKDANGLPVLNLRAAGAGGSAYILTARLA